MMEEEHPLSLTPLFILFFMSSKLQDGLSTDNNYKTSIKRYIHSLSPETYIYINTLKVTYKNEYPYWETVKI